MESYIDLEIYINGSWKEMGRWEMFSKNIPKGYRAPGIFQYSLDYVSDMAKHLHAHGNCAATVRYPLNFGPVVERKGWPSFFLDLIPAGAARQNWLKRLGLIDGFNSDFALLQKGAINPPGNIRVKFLDGESLTVNKHKGFDQDDVTNRGIDFIEYAEAMGAIVAGASGAQGVAPKFLLVVDEKGKWHGDGAISDNKVKQSWLMKFPRGKKPRDYLILELEAKFYEIAKALGVRVHGPIKWKKNNLFIPRFDRAIDAKGKLQRFGLESLTSAMGVSEFGQARKHEEFILTIRKYSNDPLSDIQEYVFRDFLNIVLGNTDNHGRNTALLKTDPETIRLSPLFDFAPMVLDDSLIPRATKWAYEHLHIPDFAKIVSCFEENQISKDDATRFLRDSEERLANLNSQLKKHQFPLNERKICTSKYDPFMKALHNYLGTE